jgi:hypothetical protein
MHFSLTVKSKAKPLRSPARSACPLLGGRLTDVHELPGTDPILLIVNLLPIIAWVDYYLDAIDGDGSFSDPGSEYQLILLRLQKDEFLIAGSDPAVEGIDLKHPRIEVFIKDVAEDVDLLNARAEDQDIALVLRTDLAAGQQDVLLNDVLDLPDGVRLVVEAPVDDLNGVEPA